MPARTCGRTAENIKEKIKKYDKFILVATEGAIASKWCNWELGFGDAQKYAYGKIALFPIRYDEKDWSESEYLELYPVIGYLDAVVTIRLIKADTGEVIWLTQQRGASKESLWKYKGVAIGSDELNNQLFVEALEKISKKVMKQMSEDMKKGVLKF